MGAVFDKTYLERIESRIFNKAVQQSAEGVLIGGLFCAFTPKELVAAAGAIPVSLCAGTAEQIPAAEARLPANLCPLIKSSYGNAVSDTCPYFHMTDFLVGDATCDGKKKMFELLSELRPLKLLHLPQTYMTKAALQLWRQELESLRTHLETMTGNTISDRSLKGQIRLYNRFRDTVCRVFEMNRGEIPAFSGIELIAVTSSGGFECSLESRIREMEAAMETARRRMQTPEHRALMVGRPRILLTGCPTTNKKIVEMVAACGGTVVAMETCGGLKTARSRVAETGDPLTALARRYLNTPCSCMSPNPARPGLVAELAEEFRVDGVLDLTWDACHTYNIESHRIEKAVSNEMTLPFLHILTDYSENDRGQLRTRIEAFFEVISARKPISQRS